MTIKKYRLDYFLNSLPHDQYCTAVKTLPAQLKVTRQTFHRWRMIKITDRSKIPADDLIALAKFFGVSAEEMLNLEPEDLTLESGDKRLEKHFGLSK